MVINVKLSFELQATLLASELLFSDVGLIVPRVAMLACRDIAALHAGVSGCSLQPLQIVLIFLPSLWMTSFGMIVKRFCMRIHLIAKVAHVPIVRILGGHDPIVLMIDVHDQQLLIRILFRFFALFFAEFASVDKLFC